MPDGKDHWYDRSKEENKQAFEKAAEPVPEQTRQEPQQGRGSEMVKRDHPEPEYPPPEWAGDVRRRVFNDQWETEREQAAQHQQGQQEQSAFEESLQAQSGDGGRQVPERSINDDFNFKADELERARLDAESAQEQLETLRGYARPINKAEKALDRDHERQQQRLTEKFERTKEQEYEDDLDWSR